MKILRIVQIVEHDSFELSTDQLIENRSRIFGVQQRIAKLNRRQPAVRPLGRIPHRLFPQFCGDCRMITMQIQIFNVLIGGLNLHKDFIDGRRQFNVWLKIKKSFEKIQT